MTSHFRLKGSFAEPFYRLMKPAFLGATLGVACASIGCSSAGPSSGSASAKLRLENTTGGGGSLSGQSGPAGFRVESITLSSTKYFAMKLASVYLAQGVDPVTQDNIGNSAMLWVSPHCTSADDCNLFDFARDTATVNLDLNSEALPVAPGTYRYIRLEFCYHGDKPTQPNVEWQGAMMSSPSGFISEECGVTSAPFNPPLTLQAGDSVSVDLSYDLSNATSVGQTDPSYPEASALTADDGHGVGFNNCDVEGTTKTCFNIPPFTPGAVKNGAGPGDTVVAVDGGVE